MYKNKNILLVVLARSGSKGIKDKNIKKIQNISLIGQVGIFSKKIDFFDEKIISTDSRKYGNIAKKFDLNFEFIRPKKLSGSKIGDLAVLRHALIKMQNIRKIKFDIIVSLPPTSPLRKINDVKKCIRMIIDKKLDAVWTISKTDKKFHPYKALKIKDDYLKFFSQNGEKIKARQQLNETYYRNGACYAFSKNAIIKNLILPRKSGYVICKSVQNSIDSINDLKMVSRLFKNY